MEVKIAGKTLVASPKTFKTGSRGFNVCGKIELDGKRYQVSGNIIEIGSKNSEAAPATEPEGGFVIEK